MEEMTTMMEVTTEETTNEMVPAVETNEVYPEENSGMHPMVKAGIVLGALAVGGAVANWQMRKACKAEPKVDVKKKLEECISSIRRGLSKRSLKVTENEESNEVNSEEE